MMHAPQNMPSMALCHINSCVSTTIGISMSYTLPGQIEVTLMFVPTSSCRVAVVKASCTPQETSSIIDAKSYIHAARHVRSLGMWRMAFSVANSRHRSLYTALKVVWFQTRYRLQCVRSSSLAPTTIHTRVYGRQHNSYDKHHRTVP